MNNKCWIVSLLIAWADHIRGGCNVPSLKPLNFYNSIDVLNGSNRTLSCEIHSDTALHKDLPFNGWKRDYPHLPAEYSLENASCSVRTPSKICIVSNLTLIDVIQSKYDGNYSLTAENDCGDSSIYVFVNIIIQPKCLNDYSRPPPLKIPPPPIVQAVQGMSVIVKATYTGRYDDNLLAFWCIVPQGSDYHCYYPTDNSTVFNVTTYGCVAPNFDCCNFVVSMEIRSSTLDQSEANLTSMAGWKQQDPSYSVGNSTLIVNPYPTLDKTYPIASNRSIELNEGQFTELICVYDASTNRSITITTWKFNDELLEQNSTHHTIITQYGNDPTNPYRVLSKLVLSNVVPDNNGTYTCQCVYNSNVIKHEGVTSEASSFYLQVKPQVKSGKKSYRIYEIAGGVVGGGIFLVVVVAVCIIIKVVRRNKPAQNTSESCTHNKSDQFNDNPTDPLLEVAGTNYESMVNKESSQSKSDKATSKESSCRDKILNLITPEMKDNSDMDTLFPYLLEHQLVTRDEEYILRNPDNPPGKKVQLLLSYLKKKGNDSLQRFLCCLKLGCEHIGHKHVADKLKQLMEANGISCTDFCSDHSKN